MAGHLNDRPHPALQHSILGLPHLAATGGHCCVLKVAPSNANQFVVSIRELFYPTGNLYYQFNAGFLSMERQLKIKHP